MALEYKNKTCIFRIKRLSVGNTCLLSHAKMLLVPMNFFLWWEDYALEKNVLTEQIWFLPIISYWDSGPHMKWADLFLVCCRSGETSAADLQMVYRSSTDYLQSCLQNVCRMPAELICNLCRRSADEGDINSKHKNRRTAPIKHLLFLP